MLTTGLPPLVCIGLKLFVLANTSTFLFQNPKLKIQISYEQGSWILDPGSWFPGPGSCCSKVTSNDLIWLRIRDIKVFLIPKKLEVSLCGLLEMSAPNNQLQKVTATQRTNFCQMYDIWFIYDTHPQTKQREEKIYLSLNQKPFLSCSHYWFKSYNNFAEWVDFAYWWSFSG